MSGRSAVVVKRTWKDLVIKESPLYYVICFKLLVVRAARPAI
jgi:hypothetical protein